MTGTAELFPESCRGNIKSILDSVKTDAHTAYAMIMMTATLMDLCPSDPKVAEIILDDCKGMRVIDKHE